MQEQIQIFDLYDVWYQPFWRKPWFIITVGLLILLLVAIIVVFVLLKKYQRKSIDVKTATLQRLDNLAGLLADGNADAEYFYRELIDTIKKYVSWRYDENLRATTETELLTALEQKIHQLNKEDITSVAASAIDSKFGKKKITIEQMNNDLMTCVEIVLHIESIINKQKQGQT